MQNHGEVTLEDVRAAKLRLTQHQQRLEMINRRIAAVMNGQLRFEDGEADVTRDKLTELRQLRRSLAPVHRWFHDSYVELLGKYAARYLTGYTPGDRRLALATVKREMRGLSRSA